MRRNLRTEDVLNATFTQTQFRSGYDEREVDDLLDRATAALRHHESGLPVAEAPLSSRAVPSVRFTSTQFRRGYDEAEVDTFLDDLAHTLRQFESGTGDPTAPSSATPTTPAGPASGLREEESLGARLLRRLRGDKG